jgi:Tfp pilus assembly protein PilX
MPLTLNQFLFLVLVIVAVVAVVFLVMLLLQLRRTAAEAEKTLAEFRDAARGLQALELSVKERLDDVGQVVEFSKKAVNAISQATAFVGSRAVKPAAMIWPILLPIVQSIWRHRKSRKEEKNVGK